MVIAVEKPVRLPWDSFLKKLTDSTPGQGEALLQHIDVFRKVDWPNIRRELRTEFRWELPDDLEPHWVDSGRAVLWQQEVLRVPVPQKDKDGKSYRVMQDQVGDWKPTTSGFRVDTASRLAAHFDKGLRLRPPEDGVDAETLMASMPSDALAPEKVVENEYFCDRHGFKRKGFSIWQAYVNHCKHYMEERAYDTPKTHLAALMKYDWRCFFCLKGFNTRKAAIQHARQERKKGGRSPHPTAELMEVAKYVEQGGGENNKTVSRAPKSKKS